nr:putative ribonuclease H-like domain-containing protein [Tanacetum cinerariifolium]
MITWIRTTVHECNLREYRKSAIPKEANNSAGTRANNDQGANSKENDLHDEHFVLPIWSAYSTTVKSSGDKIEKNEKPEATHDSPDANTNSTNLLNVVSAPVSAVGPFKALNDAEPSYPDDPSMPHLEDIFASSSAGIFTNSSYDDESVVTDFNNLETTMNTRSKVKKNSEAHALISQALEDESWVDAMQEELMQFQIKKVWILVDLPFEKKAIGTKWVYKNKKDKRGVIVRNKARLVSQGHRQEEGIDYDEVFAHVARIEAIRIFLAFSSYMGFIVYQMDVKSAFLYGTINEEVYVTQPPGFVDPKFPNKVYKVVKALYRLHQAPKAWYATLSTFLERSRYRKGAIDKTLFIKQDKKDIMLVQVYVDDIIFGSTKKSWCNEFEELMKNRFQMIFMGELTFFLGLQTASTPIETQKPLVKDEEAADVDVTPKTSHLQAVKRIFRVITPLFENILVPAAEEVGQAQDDKFNFSRYILLSLVKNIEVGVPFYMFLRFVQLIVDHQLGDMYHHQDIYHNPLLTKKVFANMKRVRTSFSRVITPLFENILVLAAEEVGQAQDDRRMIADMDEDVEDINEEKPAEVEEVFEVVIAAKLITEVVTTTKPTTTVAQVPNASAPRRRMGVVIQDPKETAASVIVHTEVL